MSASQTSRRFRSLLNVLRFANADIGIVYLKPGPPVGGRMTATAIASFGACLGEMIKLVDRPKK